MNEEVIDQRMKDLYNDDLASGVAGSEALIYAIEEDTEAILSLLLEKDESEIIDTVRKLQENTYGVFREQNYDSVSRTIVSG